MGCINIIHASTAANCPRHFRYTIMDTANWLGLLKWSLAQSDGTAPTDISTMSEEDKKWLEQVMRDGVRDEPARMNQIFSELTKILEDGPTRDQSDTIEDYLEDLRQIIEQVDMAMVFAKFGGLHCLVMLTECTTITDEVRALAASTFGSLTQNNLVVQDIVYKAGVLDKLTTVFMSESSPLLCSKVLYAISCTIRNHATFEEYFMLHCSEAVLPKALRGIQQQRQSDVPAHVSGLAVRALFLSNALIISDSSTTSRIAKLLPFVVPDCFIGLQSESIDLRENTAQLLTTLHNTHDGWSALHTSSTNRYTELLMSIIQDREAALETVETVVADPSVPVDTETMEWEAEGRRLEREQLQQLRAMLWPSSSSSSSSSSAAAAVGDRQPPTLPIPPNSFRYPSRKATENVADTHMGGEMPAGVGESEVDPNRANVNTNRTNSNNDSLLPVAHSQAESTGTSSGCGSGSDGGSSQQAMLPPP